VIASAFVVGWQLRQQSLDAVERYGVAVHDVARREALLEEALLEMDAMRKAGPGGRYTGTTLAGFRLAAVIGRGSMGEVYEAVQVATGARAAVKVIHADRSGVARAVERFDREIRLAAALDTPHVARVIGHSEPGDPVQYLAMERLVGASLADLVRRRAMPVGEVLELLDQVASAVDLAHRSGIVHRDLKPSNLFRQELGSTGVWKVLDFGVSKVTDLDSSLTGGGLVGTPGYMAPEQATGGEVGPAADVFSLGAIAYRALVGRPAFSGPDVHAILDAVTDAMPPRPTAAAPLPADVDHVLAIAMAKQPEHRFATARELVEALAPACRAELPEELRRRGEALTLLYPWRV
jgi:serine/threonine-protein kinase